VALMRTVQDVTFGVTSQLVYFDAPEGRASSVTSASVFIWDVSDDDTAESAIGSPSVETNPNTTIDAASGWGQTDPRILNVTATTGMTADRTFLVTGADGFKEWFDVAEIDSGNSVTARHPLHNAYASADTVQSTRLQATIDSTWVADESNLLGDDIGPNPHYRIRWVYVVGGVTYVADSYFNLVRYAARHGVRPQDIEAMLPGWLDDLPTDHRNTQGRALIDEAYRAVRFDIRKIDLAAANIAESEVIDELVRYKAIALRAYTGLLRGGGSAEAMQASRLQYQDQLDSLLRIVSRVPVRDSTGAATPVIAIGLSRR
jgi:hypothetical protein